jgi:hypothetical protein
VGLVVGGVLAFVTGGVLVDREAKGMQMTVDGWSAVRQCGEPGNDILLQAACASDWTAANLPAEAVYWTTTVDSAGQTLSGHHDYFVHFPPSGLPLNDAFWSLAPSARRYNRMSPRAKTTATMSSSRNRNSIARLRWRKRRRIIAERYSRRQRDAHRVASAPRSQEGTSLDASFGRRCGNWIEEG